MLAKLLAKKATTGKMIKKTMMFTFGDLANPEGTEPDALLALTEESAKILARCNTTLKFKFIPSFSEGFNNRFDIARSCQFQKDFFKS